uniref:Uncharacterized protein n=1 Tax=Candidatus Kentrum sp. FM TaxID=2126340 RepID=A0A450SAD5_9GAMM|nr:MAG: hypothetical protein BECKFM1743A_GA0114220_100659 [Candidatus Kentron sp. FM]VFJ49375.1 MAG: hypothetical protein BECKFM1743C_GA0114222_100709 [Candidatus Kentron sp. FM]VFK08275.1 MAG: hypothetical protein BECKFM1743B_GA0114221_100649 [Candidatus Kentron sp. FM]
MRPKAEIPRVNPNTEIPPVNPNTERVEFRPSASFHPTGLLGLRRDPIGLRRNPRRSTLVPIGLRRNPAGL